MLKTLGAAGAFALLILAPACTDLVETPQSAITPENFYRNEDEVVGVAIEILEFDVVHCQNLRVQEYHFVVVPEEVSLGRESARQRDGRIIEAQ